MRIKPSPWASGPYSPVAFSRTTGLLEFQGPGTTANPTAASINAKVTSYWKLDEASGTRNDSKGTNHLTDNNTVTQSAGKIATAGQFTAANNEFLNISSNATLQAGNTDYTFAAWIWQDSAPGQAAVVTKGGAREYLWLMISGQPRLYMGLGGDQVAWGSALSTGAWHFVVMWRDHGLGTINVQANNGTPVSASAADVTPDTEEFRMGNMLDGLSPFDGRIDEMLYAKAVLTSDERTYLYNAGSGRTYPLT